MLGLARDESIATLREWLARIHPDDVEGLRDALGAHLSGATPHLQHEHRVTSGNSGYRWGHGVKGRNCRNGGAHNKTHEIKTP